MKVKICVLTLLIVGLVLGLSSNVMANITFSVTAGTNTITTSEANTKKVVIAAFTATETAAAVNTITTFSVDNPGTGVTAEVDSISIFVDVNGDGKYDSGDTIVPGATTGATTDYDVGGTVVTLTPDPVESIAASGTKDYLVVINMTKTITDGHTFGAIINGTIGSGALTPATMAAGALDVIATHLQWVTSNLQLLQATGVEILPAAGNGLGLLLAVDDYGNVDAGFVEGVLLTAQNMFTGANEETEAPAVIKLTAIGGAGGADCTTGGTPVVMSSGVILNDVTTAATANGIRSIKFTKAGGPYAITLVATTQTKKLVGTATVTIGAAYPSILTKGISDTRGIELYDTDHNGHLDHATLVFDVPVTGTAGTTLFSMSGYTVKSVIGTNFDAGGVGIVNVGEYGITIELTEKSAYDTAAIPEVQYTGTILKDKTGAADLVPTINTAQAIEVDRARPVLLSALTKDSGVGIGTEANGRLDGFVLTFSEPVANYTAGADSAKHSLYIEPGLAFNQGNGALDGSELTIPVGETTINTGDTPTVYYNLGVPVTDNATSASGAVDPNIFFPDKNDYSVETSFAMADGAPMVVYQVKTVDSGVADGHIDQILVTFSEDPLLLRMFRLDMPVYCSIRMFPHSLPEQVLTVSIRRWRLVVLQNQAPLLPLALIRRHMFTTRRLSRTSSTIPMPCCHLIATSRTSRATSLPLTARAVSSMNLLSTAHPVLWSR